MYACEKELRDMIGTSTCFSGHVCECVFFADPWHHQWVLRNPQFSAYWFTVTMWPGAIVFRGDSGTAVFGCYEKNVFAWLREAVFDPEYLAKKAIVPNFFAWNPDVADEWCEAECEKIRTRMRESESDDILGRSLLPGLTLAVAKAYDEGERAFGQAISDLNIRGLAELPDCRSLTSEFLYIWKGLRFFLSKVSGDHMSVKQIEKLVTTLKEKKVKLRADTKDVSAKLAEARAALKAERLAARAKPADKVAKGPAKKKVAKA